MRIRIDLRLYSKEALLAVMYNFSGQYDISQRICDDDSNYIEVSLSPKDLSPANDINETNLSAEFERRLIDQQLRLNINKEFGHIRDLIVEEAFKPVSK